MVSTDTSLKPLIINGRPLKSMNQFYNKEKARLMSFVGNKGTSNRIEKLAQKRNQKVNYFMHKTSRLIADINGSANIIRKVVPNAFADGIEALGLTPLKILPS